MSLPYLPLQTGESKRDLDALYGYMGDFIGDFANAVGNAVDPKSGEGGAGALTVDDIPTNIQYEAGSGLSIDETIFGHIEVSADLPDRAVDMSIRYKETGTTKFKVSHGGSDDSSFRVTSLKVGESYQIQIAGRAANNSVGPYSPLTTITIPTTGFTRKAPANAEYVVTQLHDSLNQEKLLTDTPTITNSTAGTSQVKLNVVTDSSVQRVDVSKNGGAIISSRREVNLIEGSNITLTIADNPGANQADIIIASGIGGVLTQAVTFYEAGAVLTPGAKMMYWSPGHGGVLTEWRLLADQVGSVVVDIWRDTYANFPPTITDVITASAKPTLTSVIKNESTTLTGWTTTFAAGDVFEFVINSITTITKVILYLTYTVV